MRQVSCFLLFSIFLSFACFAEQSSPFNPRGITIAIEKTPMSFNPFAAKELIPQQFRHLFFDPLFRWNKQHQIEPRLVSSWKRIDNKTVRFYLRKDIKFHSGNKLTSKDVIWSFKQAKKEKKQNTKFFKKVTSVKWINRHSFDINSSFSDFQLLDFLTYVFVLDASFYRKHKTLLTTPPSILLYPITGLPLSGTGPYLVNDFNPALGIEAIANPHYWDGEPRITYLRFMRVKNAQSRLFALLADDVQVSDSIPNKSINGISESDTKHLVKVPSTNAVFLTINDKLSPGLSDRNTRKAIHLAINQQGMLKHILNGTGRVNASFMSLAETRFMVKQDKPEPAPLEFDLKAAKKLLKNSVLPKKMSLLVMSDETGNTGEVANTLMHMFNKIGIHLVITKVTSKEQWNKTYSSYDFTVSSWHTRLMSRDNVYEDLFMNSHLTIYLKDKFKQADIKEKSHSKKFDALQEDDWIIPLFFQDKIWAKYESLNLEDIFSTNGIPYWSLLKVRAHQQREVEEH